MYKEPGTYTKIKENKESEVKYMIALDNKAPITSTDKVWSIKKINDEFSSKTEMTKVSSELETVKINLATDLKLTGTKLQLKKSDGSVVGTGIDLPTGSGGSVDLSAYQTKEDGKLNTFNKEIVGAINENNSKTLSAFINQGAEKITKGYMVFIDDDGKIETFTKTRAIFNKKNKKFVSAVSTSLLDTNGYMTLENIKTLQKEGHEIASHMVRHLGITGENNWKPEIRQSKQWLEERGIKCNSLVYVGGAYNEDAINETKKWYKSAVCVGRGINKPPIKQFELVRYAVGSMNSGGNVAGGIVEDLSEKQYHDMVDLAKNNNALVMTMMHNWHKQFTQEQETLLENMIDYCNSQGVEIITIEEAINIFGNKVDIGNNIDNQFLIGADGKIQNKEINSLNSINIPNTGITINSNLSDFPQNKISHCVFQSGQAQGFPEQTAGLLTTYNISEKYYVCQYWYPYTSKYIYYRKYDWSKDTWFDFGRINIQYSEEEKIITNSINIPNTGITINSSIDAFPLEKISYCIFQSEQAQGFPEDDAGFLQTFNLKDKYYTCQYWYPFNSKNIYYRKFNWRNNSWYEFGKITIEYINDKKLNLVATTIDANSVKELSLPFDNLDSFNDNFNLVLASPVGGLEQNLGYCVVVKNSSTIVLRIINPTSNPIIMGEKTWLFKFI